MGDYSLAQLIWFVLKLLRAQDPLPYFCIGAWWPCTSTDISCSTLNEIRIYSIKDNILHINCWTFQESAVIYISWFSSTGCDSLSRLHLPRLGPRSIHVTQDSHGVNRHLRARWSTDLKMVLQQEEISSVQAHTYRKRDLSHYTYYAGMGYFSPPRCTLMCCGGFLL